jgi:uncharacterized protein YcnI
MRCITRAASRALITFAASGAAISTGMLAGTAPAWAHVRVDADSVTPGSYAVLTFKVPNESDKGALTTQLSIVLPDVASASTELMPGWTARLDRDAAAGTVRSVTWTAAPGTGVGPDEFALFRVSVKLPDSKAISLPATQTYSDGTVVKWDQSTPPSGAEPEYPVPELALTAATAAAPDNTSRWLAGGALALAAVALATALLVRRRG